ncbi:MAG: class I SAM-dependent methyltransferase [Betaproteobacteria bacterium]|nr:class I SAM-dependent methyltransferase [Betaproteobacteria bacterium]
MIRTISQTLPVSALIEQATQDIPGWSPQDQLLSLFTLAFGSTHLEGDILELGSWCGRSAVALGLAAKLSGKGTVHCVDLFPEKNDWYQNADGTYSFAVTLDGRKYGAYGEQTVWAAPYLRDIAPVYERYAGTLEAFNAAISWCDLTDWVKPFKGDLHKFASSAPPGMSVRLAFIDGDHSYSAVAGDIRLTEQFLRPGGWICFDDAFSSYDGVNEAIQKHIIESGRYQCCQQITRKLFVAQRRVS